MLCLPLLVCCHKKPCDLQQTDKTIITKKYRLPPFQAIVVGGNATVKLVNGSYAATITDTQKHLANYTPKIKDDVLHITASNTAIKIAACGLNKITVADNATINAKKFKAKKLTIIAHHNGTINLEGHYGINQIYQRGNGRINISWINSDKLYVDSNSKGPIYLAGVANSITTKLIEHAQLDARYLRAQNASILTTDHAQADILVLNHLWAYAIENSCINYYKRPKKITVVTKESGNVLHPDWMR